MRPPGPDPTGGQRVRRLQGAGARHDAAARQLRADAMALEQAGAAMLLLECVPSELAAEITLAVKIPVIGIGAGSATDGQVLVMHDLLGLSLTGRMPKFVKNSCRANVQAAFAALRARRQRHQLPRRGTRVLRMNTVKTVLELRAAVARARGEGKRIAFVPTMGNLHEGHVAHGGESRPARRLRGRQYLRQPAAVRSQRGLARIPAHLVAGKNWSPPVASCCSIRTWRKCTPMARKARLRQRTWRLRGPVWRQPPRPLRGWPRW